MYSLRSVAAEVFAPQRKQGLHDKSNERCVTIWWVSNRYVRLSPSELTILRLWNINSVPVTQETDWQRQFPLQITWTPIGL